MPAQCHCRTGSSHAGTPLGVWISLRSCLAPMIAPQDSFTTPEIPGSPSFSSFHLNLGQTLFLYHLLVLPVSRLTQRVAFQASSFLLAICSIFSILVFFSFDLVFSVLNLNYMRPSKAQAYSSHLASASQAVITCVFHPLCRAFHVFPWLGSSLFPYHQMISFHCMDIPPFI